MAKKIKMPLSVAMENAKGRIVQAVSQVSNDMELPAFLLEGIVADVLSEIRSKKNLELLADINSMRMSTEKQPEEKQPEEKQEQGG